MPRGKRFKEIEAFRTTLWEKKEIPPSTVKFDKAFRIAVKQALIQKGFSVRRFFFGHGYSEKAYMHFQAWINGYVRAVYVGLLFDILDKAGISYPEVVENAKRIYHNSK